MAINGHILPHFLWIISLVTMKSTDDSYLATVIMTIVTFTTNSATTSATKFHVIVVKTRVGDGKFGKERVEKSFID